MKKHEPLPSLDEIKAYARSKQGREQHAALEAAKLRIEDLEAEEARLALVAIEGAEALEREKKRVERMRTALQLVLDFHNPDTQAFVKKYGHGFGTRQVCDVVREALK